MISPSQYYEVGSSHLFNFVVSRIKMQTHMSLTSKSKCFVTVLICFPSLWKRWC